MISLQSMNNLMPTPKSSHSASVLTQPKNINIKTTPKINQPPNIKNNQLAKPPEYNIYLHLGKS